MSFCLPLLEAEQLPVSSVTQLEKESILVCYDSKHTFNILNLYSFE